MVVKNSKSGGGVRLGFEGGQITAIQRIPKEDLQIVSLRNMQVNVADLNRFERSERSLNFDLMLQSGGLLAGKGWKF